MMHNKSLDIMKWMKYSINHEAYERSPSMLLIDLEIKYRTLRLICT